MYTELGSYARASKVVRVVLMQLVALPFFVSAVMLSFALYYLMWVPADTSPVKYSQVTNMSVNSTCAEDKTR